MLVLIVFGLHRGGSVQVGSDLVLVGVYGVGLVEGGSVFRDGSCRIGTFT